MFARAFDCYVKDKLAEKGIRDDYLNGLCEYACPVPKEEREFTNKAIEKFIDKTKELGLIASKEVNYDLKLSKEIEKNFPEQAEMYIDDDASFGEVAIEYLEDNDLFSGSIYEMINEIDIAFPDSADQGFER